MISERLKKASVADDGGEVGGDEHLAPQRLSQGLDARDFVDRRPDDGEVEAIHGADIAIEDLAEVEREVMMQFEDGRTLRGDYFALMSALS